jgi:hypothetical protein
MNKRFTGEQIIGFLKEALGWHAGEGARPMGVCERRDAKIDSAGQTNAECVHRVVRITKSIDQPSLRPIGNASCWRSIMTPWR